MRWAELPDFLRHFFCWTDVVSDVDGRKSSGGLSGGEFSAVTSPARFSSGAVGRPIAVFT
jgi:hypothetical protein